MTIYAYYGDYSQHKNEQLMFNDLLTQLKLQWQYNDEWIYLFYNTMWSGEEIDVIAFTQHSIIVIDLKNYSGDLSGAENGEWIINSSIPVLGGKQINPFVQVRKNKFAVLEYFQSHGLFSNQNLGFIAGCIIFNELSHKHIDLSAKVKRWFYVSDIAHAADQLANIKSTDINLAEDDMQYLVRHLSLKEHRWDQYKQPRDILYDLGDDVLPTVSPNSHSAPSHIQLKYSLEKKVKSEIAFYLKEYVSFFITLTVVLTIAYLIAANMQKSGLGIFYIHNILFGLIK